MRFPSYLAEEDACDDGELVQRPQRSSKGRGRDLADVHGHESGGEPCTEHTRVSPPPDTAQQPAQTTPQTGKEDGARVLHPTPHQAPRSWLGTTCTLERCWDVPAFRAPNWEDFLLEHTRQSLELGEVITGQRAFLKLALKPRSGVLYLHSSNSDKELLFLILM